MSKELIIGKNPVLEVLASKREVYSVSILDKLNKKTADEIYEAAQAKGVVVTRVSRGKLVSLTNGRHKDTSAAIEGYSYVSLEELFDLAESKDEQPFFIILDEIEDPHNSSAILRTADATGAH